MKFVIGLVILFSSVVFADVYDRPQFETVMSKKYRMRSELTLDAGYLPIGSYSKYTTAGAAYTYQVNVVHGWEVLNYWGAQEIRQNLKKELLNSYGAVEEDFAVLKSIVTSNYVYSPFYTKSILFNSSVV